MCEINQNHKVVDFWNKDFFSKQYISILADYKLNFRTSFATKNKELLIYVSLNLAKHLLRLQRILICNL